MEAIARRVEGERLERIRLLSPFVLRSVAPPIGDATGKRVIGFRRIGKRIVLVLEGDLFLVIHLMIAGRFRWTKAGGKAPGRIGLAAFDFAPGTLLLTEAGSKKRASIRLVAGEGALAELDPGGVEPLEVALSEFRAALSLENRTLKRALTDSTIVAGIGNAYSDEILHAARLSPYARSSGLSDEEWTRLHAATVRILESWTAKLRAETGDGFPEKVTAFRPEMAAHGRYREPCPVCGTPIARIVYAENEANYCPACQTGGKLLADRALSRLLHGDWPKSWEELEERRAAHRNGQADAAP